jgi:LAO/AO transport system kinase
MIALGSEAMVAAGKRKGHVVHGKTAGLGESGGGESGESWIPPIVRCVSIRGEGVQELASCLDRHKAWLDGTETGRARRRDRLAEELRDGLREALVEAATSALGPRIDEAVRKVEAKEVDPYTATEELVAAFKGR